MLTLPLEFLSAGGSEKQVIMFGFYFFLLPFAKEQLCSTMSIIRVKGLRAQVKARYKDNKYVDLADHCVT